MYEPPEAITANWVRQLWHHAKRLAEEKSVGEVTRSFPDRVRVKSCQDACYYIRVKSSQDVC